MKNSVILSAAAGVVAFVAACSSASSSAASNPPDEAGPMTCQGASDCKTDEICCISATMLTACVAKSTGCPSTPIGRIQVCAGADECWMPGATCGPAAFHTAASLTACSVGAPEGGTSPALDPIRRVADGG